MYFENNTGDKALDHWRKGISDLLITDLMESKYLKVLGGDQLVNILKELDQLETQSYSSEVLKKVAAQAGVDHIARGSYSRAGNILRIDMVLQEAESGNPIATTKVEGETEAAIFTMVDELTKWTKESLMLSARQMADDLDEKIGTVTTSSPEAYKFYMEGHNFYKKEQYEQSILSLSNAIAQDPGFAMAYRKIAMAYGNLNKPNESKKYLQKALDLAYYESGDLQRAREKFEELIHLIPGRNSWGDLYALSYYKLGLIYEEQGEASKAAQHYEKFLDLWKDADPFFSSQVEDARKRLAELDI